MLKLLIKLLMKSSVALALLTCSTTNLMARDSMQVAKIRGVHCGTDQQMQRFYDNNPGQLSQEIHQRSIAREKIRTFDIQPFASEPEMYTIPVVVHVYGDQFNNGSTIDLALIKNALASTSHDFQGLTADYNDVEPRFSDVKDKLNIEFKLATIDPNGNPTTGVIFHSSRAGYGNDSSYDEQIASDAWDNYKYMNIYIMNDLYDNGDLYNSGVAWYPNTSMSDNNLSRVVYNGSYLGKNTNENFRSVLTHEFGHWLDLRHTFNGGCEPQNQYACSTSGDLICDTPQQDNSGIDQGDLNCVGQPTNWQNFMDYSDQYANFTKNQIARVKAALQLPSRVSLWQPHNLSQTGVFSEPAPGILFSATKINETFDNDGTLNKKVRFSAVGGVKFAKNGELIQNIDYIISGLPTGINAVVSLNNQSSGQILLSGQALSHDVINNSSLSIQWLAPAIEIPPQGDKPLSSKIAIEFNAPYDRYNHHAPKSTYHDYVSIYRVQLAQVDNSSGDNGYSDLTTQQVANVSAGEVYQLNVTLDAGKSKPSDQNRLRIWADWNGDYVFTQDELIATENQVVSQFDAGKYLFTLPVNIPHYADNSKPIAIRIVSHWVNNADGDMPYGNLVSGEIEDYGLNINSPTLDLVAEFKTNTLNTHIHNGMLFTDLSRSVHNITSWQWQFPGGSPDSASGQNPGPITYYQDGRYDVTLTVTDDAGNSHTTTKYHYANAVFGPRCMPKADWVNYSHIAGVDFADIHNNTENNGGSGYSAFYNQFVTSVSAGETYQLTIGSNPGNAKNDFQRTRAWFDWNGNGLFEADEAMLDHSYLAPYANVTTPVSTDITIPEDAVKGKIMMRILNTYNGNRGQGTWGDTACDDLDSGEYQDYMLVIDGETPQSIDYSQRFLREAFTNGGTLENKDIEISTTNNIKFATSGKLTSGVDYQLTGVPEGLTASLIVSNDHQAILSLNGRASAHQPENNSTIRLTWLDSAFKQGLGNITEPTVEFDLAFYAPYSGYDHKVPEISYCCYITTTNVTIGDDINVSSGNESYVNHTKEHVATVRQGENLDISITMGAGASEAEDAERVRVWADWNGDLVFSENELIGTKSFVISDMINGSYTYQLSVPVPNNAVTDQAIALRIISHFVQDGGGDTAYNLLESGDVEDYGLYIEPDPQLPLKAQFGSVNPQVDITQPVKFFNLSGGASEISNWQWYFEGGRPQSYQGATPPPVFYGKTGHYDVSLTVTDTTGASICHTKNDFVKVDISPSCQPQSKYSGYSHISGLKFVDIDNVTNNIGGDGYSSFTGQFSTRVQKGQTYPLTLFSHTGTTYGDEQRAKVWIDFNGDRHFNESDEVVFDHSYTGGDIQSEQELNANITIANQAVSGEVLMRALVAYNGADGYGHHACQDLDSGEYEDYLITLTNDPIPGLPTGPKTPPGSVIELVNDQPLNALAAEQGESLLFSILVPPGASSLTVTSSGLIGDANLYLQYQTQPDDNNFICRPFISGSDEYCEIEQPDAGVWYIILYGYQKFSESSLIASYQLTAPPVANANGPYKAILNEPVHFSSQGSTLDNNIVSYQWEFGDGSGSKEANPSHYYQAAGHYKASLTVTNNLGVNSQATAEVIINEPGKIPVPGLITDQPVKHLSAVEGEMLPFVFDVPAHAKSLTVLIKGGQGDADLYLRHGSTPDDITFDCHPNIKGNQELCTIEDPTAGRWYINVQAFKSFEEVTLTAYYLNDSPPVSNVPDACSMQTPITDGRLTSGEALCLGEAETIWLEIAEVNKHNSLAISTGHGLGDLSVSFSNSGWPGATNTDANSENIGNSECIYLTELSQFWGYIKVSASSGGATIIAEFDSPACR